VVANSFLRSKTKPRLTFKKRLSDFSANTTFAKQKIKTKFFSLCLSTFPIKIGTGSGNYIFASVSAEGGSKNKTPPFLFKKRLSTFSAKNYFLW
jgi:hypothetical protein